ncbi:hypothetical protein [Bdellovibrio svalbardensis]|uniref:Uncharacterized protein n=1 Tax=Bdellovibrio svalbardensis TaxID=2972972 RepID=A0ABT6DKU3_9BACT|nr:hypothetical protein [Bdellovibrio svalbardensis]MDG0817179.1 hypothetical protein [Bdellovibrio svalbardensis]
MRCGDDVIKSELLGVKLCAAVLAGVIIADIYIFAAEPHGMIGPGSNVGPQPQNTGQLKP